MQHLLLRQGFITNPSCSILVLKNLLTSFFKFLGQFHNFGVAGTKYQNPGLSRTIWDVWHVWLCSKIRSKTLVILILYTVIIRNAKGGTKLCLEGFMYTKKYTRGEHLKQECSQRMLNIP